MNRLDKLKQAWQAQRCFEVGADPDTLLKVNRLGRQFELLADVIIVSFFTYLVISTLWWVFGDFPRKWPQLIYAAGAAWVAGFMLFDRWRRRRKIGKYDESMLAHVEWSIQEIQHRMWLDRCMAWWYVLPLALGCMIPPVISFAIGYLNKPDWAPLGSLLGQLVSFAILFFLIYLFLRFAVRLGLNRRQQELDALQALRESLLNAEE